VGEVSVLVSGWGRLSQFSFDEFTAKLTPGQLEQRFSTYYLRFDGHKPTIERDQQRII